MEPLPKATVGLVDTDSHSNRGPERTTPLTHRVATREQGTPGMGRSRRGGTVRKTAPAPGTAAGTRLLRYRMTVVGSQSNVRNRLLKIFSAIREEGGRIDSRRRAVGVER
ncbi:hypothetical protein [Natrinema gari]|uniref:Uncharacterized protein n=1 Tax=Natrinema gari JCM 14663 TaxID=1230459 RepID=L9Z8M8_9EURY|nr:hypothetical protein [Natrinema gari]ELY82724.1 hypothetical protein C486_04208 [Natrinema gari JCM 14663]